MRLPVQFAAAQCVYVRGTLMTSRAFKLSFVLFAFLLALPGTSARALSAAFSTGDLFISLENGPIQWRLADGTLNQILVGTVPGTGEGMGFDSTGNLYVSRWCLGAGCYFGYSGNTVEKFDTLGRSLGPVGSGYNCSPHAIVFDATDTAYVGQGGCTGAILKFLPGMTMPTAYAVVPEYEGSFWIDLAPDRCTILYTSFGANVKQFDVCAGVQLPDFNRAPLPGGIGQDLRILDDGGVIVSSGDVIARLDASGALVATYAVPGSGFWAGLDLVGDGSFWAASYNSSNVYRFDLATGAVLAGFNAGTPPQTVVGVRVRR